MAEIMGRGSGCDGVHRSVLEAGVERAGGGTGGRLQTDAGQRAALQAGAWAQDRPEGCGVAGGAGATRAGEGQLCAAEGDAAVARSGARPGKPDGGPHGGGQPVAEGAGGRQNQAVECGEQRIGGAGPAGSPAASANIPTLRADTTAAAHAAGAADSGIFSLDAF